MGLCARCPRRVLAKAHDNMMQICMTATQTHIVHIITAFALSRGKILVVTFLVLMHPALLIVDHIHFQVANMNRYKCV